MSYNLNKFLLYSGLILGTVLLLIVLSHSQNSLSKILYPKPETFTELYFNDHLHIPTKAIPNNPISFEFVIHNLEGKDMNYTYQVSVNNDLGKDIRDTHSIVVKSGGIAKIPETIQFGDTVATRSAIYVNLLNKNQHINFYVMKSYEEL